MKEKIKSLRKQRDIILAAMASNAMQLMAIESELQRVETLAPRDLPPPLVAIFVGILIQLLTEMGAAMERSGPLKPIPAVVSGAETTKEPESKPIVADSEAEETTPTEIFPPKDDSPESRLEKHFGPARPPIVTALGCVLDFSERGYVRFELPGGKFDEIKLSPSEWETALALLEASGHGLSHIDLASKVTRWRGKIPNPEAVQRMVSRITGRFESAGMPFRGRTENVHPSGTSAGGPISSTKRRPGRPPKANDGQFRAFLHEISPSISSC